MVSWCHQMRRIRIALSGRISGSVNLLEAEVANAIWIPVGDPVLLNDKEALRALLTRSFKDPQGGLSGPLLAALDLALDDDHAVLDDVVVDGAEIADGSITVRYTVSFSAAQTCRDLVYSDKDARTLVGQVTETQLGFPVFVAPEPRSTADEL